MRQFLAKFRFECVVSYEISSSDYNLRLQKTPGGTNLPVIAEYFHPYSRRFH